MINTTVDQLVINSNVANLSGEVRRAIDLSADILLTAYGLKDTSWSDITIRKNSRGQFSKLAKLCIQQAPAETFDSEYLNLMFKICMRRVIDPTQAEYDRLACVGASNGFEYLIQRAKSLNMGMGVALVLLHTWRVVTLPRSFRWPHLLKPSEDAGQDIGSYLDEGLLKLVRSTCPTRGEYQPSFDILPDDKNARIDLLSRGTRAVLALGWQSPADANVDDLKALVEAIDKQGEDSARYTPYIRQLIQLWVHHYGAAIRLTLGEFDALLKSSERQTARAHAKTVAKIAGNRANVFDLSPQDGRHEVLELMDAVPGLETKLEPLCKDWFAIQKSFLKARKKKIQRQKTDIAGLGYLNIYLFYFLPYWFADNPNTKLVYPSCPNLLLTSIYVSPILDHDFEAPLRLVEFLDLMASSRNISNESLYGYLKSIEAFFAHISKHSKELPGSDGFSQPLSSHDFPLTSRGGGTNKRPIPRKLFSFWIRYAECMVAYGQVLLQRILSGEVSQEFAQETFGTGSGRAVIDAFAVADVVGFIPLVYFDGKCVPIRIIQNVYFVDEKLPLKDGRFLKLPQPHGLIQILIALYTGIRNQHIQWLDVRTFDSLVSAASEFAQLYVNTDKVKRKPWAAYVNARVIDVLRIQKDWRGLIAFQGFEKDIPYEGNENSPWPLIRPLFSLSYDGTPHHDSRYADTWSRVMMGVQGMLSEIGLGKDDVDPLFELLPTDISLDDEPSKKAERYGLDSKWMKDLGEREQPFVPLVPKGLITPHSARVTIVSNYIQCLPADVIGTYITGQKEAVVYTYVNLDSKEYADLQAQQSVTLNLAIIGADIAGTDELGSGAVPPRFLKADHVNASLVKGIRSRNIEETIARFGCISLVTSEDGKSGIDVLKETRGLGVAFNKTEICPYGNVCPPDVVKALRGWQRCGLCPFAVRSIDHLPPVAAKRKQMMERLRTIEAKLEDKVGMSRRSSEEQNELMVGRQRLAEEALGYKLAEEVLEIQRQKIAAGLDSREWVVPMPDIIRANLERIESPDDETLYVLARLTECVAYPNYDSPEIRAKFDLLRRQLLAKNGSIREALTSPVPTDAALECLAQLKAVADANGIAYSKLPEFLSQEIQERLPEHSTKRVLLQLEGLK